MRRFAVIAKVKFTLPPVQELERAHGIGHFVAQIIGPTAVGIDVVEMLMKRFGEKPGAYVEVFVMMRGEPVCVLLRDGGRATRWGGVAHDFEFATSKHLENRLTNLRRLLHFTLRSFRHPHRLPSG